jgi:hypothetical protein
MLGQLGRQPPAAYGFARLHSAPAHVALVERARPAGTADRRRLSTLYDPPIGGARCRYRCLLLYVLSSQPTPSSRCIAARRRLTWAVTLIPVAPMASL